MQVGLSQRMQQLDYLARRLLSPMQQVAHKVGHLDQLNLRLQAAISRLLQQQSQHLMRLEQNLNHLSPHAVLNRGYALAQTTQGHIVRTSSQLSAGQTVQLTFGQGQADADITRIKS